MIHLKALLIGLGRLTITALALAVWFSPAYLLAAHGHRLLTGLYVLAPFVLTLCYADGWDTLHPVKKNS